MDQSTSPEPAAETPGAPLRRVHDHAFPGVDLAAASFPRAGEQRAAIQRSLDSTLQSALCVSQLGNTTTVQAILENVAAGHAFPSGATQDRRLWVEIVASSGSDVIYRSGSMANPDDGTPGDPDLWLLRDCLLGASGEAVSMLWEAYGYQSNTLPAQATFDPTDPRYYQLHVDQTYPRRGSGSITLPGSPDRVTMRVRLLPIGLSVLDDLVRSGDLDPAIRDDAPVFTVGGDPMLEWTPEAAASHEQFRDHGIPTSCVSKTNLSGAADKVLTTPACSAGGTGTDAGAADTGGLGESSSGDGGGLVGCSSDPRVDRADASAIGLSKTSMAGVFRVDLIATDPSPPAKGDNAWTVQVRTAGGDLMEGATVGVEAQLPDFRHRSPVQATVTPASTSGTYIVSPLFFFMPGVWSVTLDVEAGGSKDMAIFYFCVEG